MACVDTQADLTAAAQKFDEDLRKFAKLGDSGGPVHVTHHLDAEATPEELEAKLDEVSGKEIGTSFGVLGLHTCGDLGPCLVRLFASRAAYIHRSRVCYSQFRTSDSHFNFYLN